MTPLKVKEDYIYQVKVLLPEDWPQFYTATIQGWKHLLKEEKFKQIIVDALKFLVESKRVNVNAFVIMDNHIHLIWQAMHGHTLKEVQTSFNRHTSKQFLKLLEADKNIELYKVNSPDRKHHFSCRCWSTLQTQYPSSPSHCRGPVFDPPMNLILQLSKSNNVTQK